MKNAIVLDPSDIKQMLADKFNVDEKKIIKNQYSYTVVLEEEECGD